MPGPTKKKTSAVNTKLGATIRRLRRQHGLTQVKMADRLGISAPYLNLIEHNRRKVTAALLLKLGDTFGLEFADLAGDDESQLLADLMEAFIDPLFATYDLTNMDVSDVVTANPMVARAVLALYDGYRRAQNDIETLAERLSGDGGDLVTPEQADFPADAVSDFIQANTNYFHDLEETADQVRTDAKLVIGDPFRGMVDYLQEAFSGVRVALLPATAHHFRHGTVRRYDPITRSLVISELLPPSSRNFQVAHQIGLMAASTEIDALLTQGGLVEGEARTLGRIALANYFAGAMLMPYAPFLEAATSVRYDIEILEHQFGTGFEQVCHRLTTLQRPGAKGIPFHMLRVDIAGNTSKRFSLSGIRIPRHGGACTRWNVYAAFMTPERLHVQVERMPDGTAYFCIARTVRNRGGGYGISESYYSIGLGCEVSHADRLVYSDGIDLDNPDKMVPVGVACRICERMDCRQRAFPPIHHRLNIDENARGLSAYVSPR